MEDLSDKETIENLAKELEVLKEQITRLRQRNKKLRELCVRDALTGLYNWRKFHHSLRRMAKSKNFACLIFFDVDNLKFHNDTYGHSGGNAILKAIANSIKKSMKYNDGSAYRFGGDEFAIILPGCNCSQAADVARAIIKNLYDLGYQDVSLSFGIVEFKGDTDDQTLLSHADRAMYLSKRDPQNKIHVYDECLPTSSDACPLDGNIY